MSLPSLFPALDATITAGVVCEQLPDGFVTVAHGASRQEVSCVPLAHVPPGSIAPGVAVLLWRPTPDADTGVIMGVIAPPQAVVPMAAPGTVGSAGTPGDVDDEVPDTLVLEAKSSLTLRVGDGSITIRADGKILIKGKDLVSHATRVNRIKGGSVSIN